MKSSHDATRGDGTRTTLLMLAPSARRAPLLDVADALSEPAKSIKFSFASVVTSLFDPGARDVRLMVSCSKACDRLDVWFALVLSVLRFWLPYTRRSITASTVLTRCSVTPAITTMPFSWSSRNDNPLLLPLLPPLLLLLLLLLLVSGFNRSRIDSLYTSTKLTITSHTSFPSLRFAMWANTSATALGMSPASAVAWPPSCRVFPHIVCVFPADVAP